MYEDCVAFHARRIRQQYAISDQATTNELLQVCEAQGIKVCVSLGLQKPGVFIASRRGPVILLRWNAPACVLAHELWHALITDRSAHGLIYCWPEFIVNDPERAANRFAELLCGPLDCLRAA